MLKAKQSLTADATLGKQYRPYINPAPISPRNLSIANQFQASSQPNKLHADFQHLPSNTSTLQEQKALSKYQQATQARRMQQGLEKAPALNPIDLPTPPPGKSLQDMQSQPFLAKGGHRVAFMQQEDGQWLARVNEHLPLGFSRKIDLLVYVQPGFSVEDLAKHDSAWHQCHIHVHFPEQMPDNQGYVLLGSLGLPGGMHNGSSGEGDNEAAITSAWEELKAEMQAKFGKTSLGSLEEASSVKTQLLAYKERVKAYRRYNFISSSSINQVIEEIGKLHAQVEDFEEHLVDKLSYNALINEINQELGPEAELINRLQDEDAAPDIIIAKATEAKPHVEAAIVRLEAFQTRQDKRASLETLREAKNQLEGIIRDFTKRRILLEKYRAAFSYARQHISKRIEKEQAELFKGIGGEVGEYEIIIVPKEEKLTIKELEEIFPDEHTNTCNLQKFLDTVNVTVNLSDKTEQASEVKTEHAAEETAQKAERQQTEVRTIVAETTLTNVATAVEEYLQEAEQLNKQVPTSKVNKEYKEKGKLLLKQVEQLKQKEDSIYQFLYRSYPANNPDMDNQMLQERLAQQAADLEAIKATKAKLLRALGLSSQELAECGIEPAPEEPIAESEAYMQRAATQAQLTQHLKTDLNAITSQLCELGLQADFMNQEALAGQLLDTIQASMKREPMTAPLVKEQETEEEDSTVCTQVDEFLQGLQEGLNNPGVALPEEIKTALSNISVEQFRSQATELVKRVEGTQREKEEFAKANEAQVQQEIAQMRAETEELLKDTQELARQEAIKKAQEEQAWQQRQEAYRLATAKRAIRSDEYFFTPDLSSDHVEQIKDYIQYLEEELEKIPFNESLPQEQQEDIRSILSQIDEQQKELRPLYRDMKVITEHRRGDMLFLKQNTSHFNNKQKEAFEKEAKIIQANREDVQLAKQLLEELKAMKEEMYSILASRNEPLDSYLEEGYESDFENDYSSEELATYIASCGQLPQEDREQAFVICLQTNLARAFKTIIARLGQEEPVTTQDFISLLQDAPQLSRHILAYYPAIAQLPTNSQAFERIKGLALHAIITAIPMPVGQTIQLKCLNELKKRMHNLTIAIKQAIAHPAQLLDQPQY